MGKVARLVTRQQREDRAVAAVIAALLRDVPEHLLAQLPRHVRVAISTAQAGLSRHARPDEDVPGGPWNVISRAQVMHVWEQIQRLPPEARPIQVRDAFMFVLLCLDQDSGEVTLSREALAAKIGCAEGNVSTIMGTLEKLGVLRRERRREPGLRGPGRAVYVINAYVAWNGAVEFRRQAAAQQTPPTDLPASPSPKCASSSRKRPKLDLVPPAEAPK